MHISVIYDFSGENNQLIPVWMMLDFHKADWTRTLYINIEAPFERLTFDEVDQDVLTLSVPDNVYVRPSSDFSRFGINLPALTSYISKSMADMPEQIDTKDIHRLMLRICDIEEIMHCEVRSVLRWY